jgi:hypothetical protein
MSLLESLHYVKKIRKIICPNEGFIEALIKFEKNLYGKNSVSSDDINHILQ